MFFHEVSRDAGAQPISVWARMRQGAGFVLALTLFRLLFYWPQSARLWMGVLVLVVAGVGGALGGFAYFATEGWRAQGGVLKTIANIVSLLAYVLFVFAALFGSFALLERGA